MIAEALRRGVSYDVLYSITKIDKWFIDKFAIIVEMEKALKDGPLTQELLKEAKRIEFPDHVIASLTGKTEGEIHQMRMDNGIQMCIRDRYKENRREKRSKEGMASLLYIYQGGSVMKIPQHVAIILDGNGRWAKKKNMPRNYGHAQGSKNVERICEAAYKMGIKYLTVYAFSTENWNRPADEVNALMKLLRNYMKTCLKTAEKNRMRVRVIGDKSGLDDDIRNRIEELEKASDKNDGLNFQIRCV